MRQSYCWGDSSNTEPIMSIQCYEESCFDAPAPAIAGQAAPDVGMDGGCAKPKVYSGFPSVPYQLASRCPD